MSRFINPVPQFWLNDGTLAVSGKMVFFENGDYSTNKDTYANSALTTENTNPVTLDGQGRMPPCFGEGLYSVKFYAYDNTAVDKLGTLQWTRDDVSLSDGGGEFSDWSAVATYSIGAAVKDNGEYYILYGSATSKGERPSTTPAKWEQITFLTVFNASKAAGDGYATGEIVVTGGFIYRSLVDGNSTTPPSADWANLTFNDSISGDLAVSGTVTAGAYAGGGVITKTTPGGNSVAVRNASKSITSSTTLEQDLLLTITDLSISSLYAIDALIDWDGQGSTSNGIKINLTGATVRSILFVSETNSTTANAAPTANTQLTFEKLPSSSGGTERIHIKALIETGGAVSDFYIRWAQSVSEATPTRVNFSYLIATKLG